MLSSAQTVRTARASIHCPIDIGTTTASADVDIRRFMNEPLKFTIAFLYSDIIRRKNEIYVKQRT